MMYLYDNFRSTDHMNSTICQLKAIFQLKSPYDAYIKLMDVQKEDLTERCFKLATTVVPSIVVEEHCPKKCILDHEAQPKFSIREEPFYENTEFIRKYFLSDQENKVCDDPDTDETGSPDVFVDCIDVNFQKVNESEISRVIEEEPNTMKTVTLKNHSKEVTGVKDRTANNDYVNSNVHQKRENIIFSSRCIDEPDINQYFVYGDVEINLQMMNSSLQIQCEGYTVIF